MPAGLLAGKKGLAVAGGSGVAGGLGLSSILGDDETPQSTRDDDQKSKKEITSETDITTDARQISPAFTHAPQIQIDSPQATQTSENTTRQKPTQRVSPQVEQPITAPTTQETGGTTQIDTSGLSELIMLGGLAGGGLILLNSFTGGEE